MTMSCTRSNNGLREVLTHYPAGATMKLLLTAFLLVGAICTPVAAQDSEITLRNSGGDCSAYIADDDDSTIYLWGGEPVAYLSADNIYGFNGKHLGWYAKGVLYNHDGNAVGAITSRFVGAQPTCPFKSFKKFKPFKSFKELAPFKPFFHLTWSDDETLRIFLKQGTK
jgi:hypothetical protein